MVPIFLKDLWALILVHYGVIIGAVGFVYGVIKDGQAKKYKSLALKPALTQWIHNFEGVDFCATTIYLMNNGLGPAHIKKFEITVDGKPIQEEGVALIEKAAESVISDYEFKIVEKSFLGTGYKMAAGEKKVICAIVFAGRKRPSSKAVDQALERLSLNIKFKSLDGKEETFKTGENTKK